MLSAKNWAKTILLSNIFLTFAIGYQFCSRRVEVSPSFLSGMLRRGTTGRVEVFRHNIRRLLGALFLTLRNFANFVHSHGHCNGRCSRDVYCHIPLPVWHFAYCEVSNIGIGTSVFISAWASTLLVQLCRAMRRPRSVGRVTRRSHAFLFNFKC